VSDPGSERELYCSILSYLSGRPLAECTSLPDDEELNDHFDPELVERATRIAEQVIAEAKSGAG
jgi:hypothetical protein